MKFPGGIVLTITDDELKAEVGKSVVTIKTDGDITIESNAKLDIKSRGNTTVSSEGDMSLSGQNIKIQESGTLDIKGAMVNIK